MPVRTLVMKYSKTEIKSLNELQGMHEGVPCGVRRCGLRIFLCLRLSPSKTSVSAQLRSLYSLDFTHFDFQPSPGSK